jgi:hypothetical protein
MTRFARFPRLLLEIIVVAAQLTRLSVAETLEVGADKKFARLEDAVAAARPGDVIAVHPMPHGAAYEKVALRVRTPRLTIKSVRNRDGGRVKLSGDGFDYSGVGATPRAIVQFDEAADGCILEGFELTGATNTTDNGAGVRIVEANDVTIRDCEIHGNDMGVMSNGDVAAGTAANQRLERCLIRDNGSQRDPGQNHNLYVGGTSVILSACEVRGSVTGHNVKSRAHHTRVEYCYIHDSANREFDLVDAKGNTDVTESHAVLIGNVIVKAYPCEGNRTVIHFGQDGGADHNGTIYLVHNTILTPYIAPVVELSAASARATLVNNIIWDAGSGQRNQRVAVLASSVHLSAASDVANELAKRVSGSHNWFAAGFAGRDGFDFPCDRCVVGVVNRKPPFANPAAGDFRLAQADASFIGAGLPWKNIKLPPPPGGSKQEEESRLLWQYGPPLSKTHRNDSAKPTLGAFSYSLP